jgi:hypothetical protein
MPACLHLYFFHYDLEEFALGRSGLGATLLDLSMHVNVYIGRRPVEC